MNMSYCRFRNTLRDLDDCQEKLFEDLDDLSEEEERARLRLIKMCHEIAQDTEYEYQQMIRGNNASTRE